MADRLPGPTRATVVSAALAGTRPTAKPSGVSTRSGGDFGSNRLSATRSRLASAAWNSGSRPSRSAAAAALCRSSSKAARPAFSPASSRPSTLLVTLRSATALNPQNAAARGTTDSARKVPTSLILKLPSIFALQFPDSLPISPL